MYCDINRGGHTFERKAPFATTFIKKGGGLILRVGLFFRKITVCIGFLAGMPTESEALVLTL